MNSLFRLAVLLCFIAAFCVYDSTNPLSAGAEDGGEEKICFQWTLGAIVGTGDDRKLLSSHTLRKIQLSTFFFPTKDRL